MYKKEPLPQEKHTNEELYRRQVETLKLFLSKHAITQAQFDKSYRDLTEKMHVRKTVVDEIGIFRTSIHIFSKGY